MHIYFLPLSLLLHPPPFPLLFPPPLSSLLSPLLRRKKLGEALAFRQFCVAVEEEEVWMREKTALLSSEDTGDTLAAVQVVVCEDVRV